MSDAVKYFQKNGLQRSKELVEMGFGFCSLEDGLSFHTDQLKQLVKSHELVAIHGLEQSKEIVKNAPSDNVYYSWTLGGSGVKDKTVHIGTLRKAIAEVESCTEAGKRLEVNS